MAAVILNWMYMLAASFLCGYAFARFTARFLAYRIENMTGVIFSGLVISTVYAQLASFMGGVGIIAGIAFALACIAVFVIWRKEITYAIHEKFRAKSAAYKITVAILILIWCYCTSRGYMHYDSDLYHAQSIRWIEEYGVVAGLGNIHVRFAYNSSFFALSALYSMRDIAGAPIHAVNGFIALLLSVEAIEMFFRFHAQPRKEEKCRANSSACPVSNIARLSDFARLGAFYYLTLIYRDIVSPASDYCVMCVVFYIIIRWLSYIEEDRQDAAYSLLCVACAYGITLKLTAGAILLLAAKPAMILLKGKRYREIAAYIFMGTLVILPWMARTAIISGYLLYPFPAIDVLNVDWKIPKAKVCLDAAEIKTWGRGLNNAALVNLPVSGWFMQWFNALPTLGKLFILLDMLCIAIFAILLITYAIKIIKKKNTSDMADKLLVIAAVASSYLFWQFSAPLLRYGYAYVLLLIFLTAGCLCAWACARSANAKTHICRLCLYGIGSPRVILICALFLAAAKTPSLAKYIVSTSDKEFYVNQQDYGAYELDSFEVDGITFYYPKSGDRTGYRYFPSIPAKIGIEFRGAGLENGFKGT